MSSQRRFFSSIVPVKVVAISLIFAGCIYFQTGTARANTTRPDWENPEVKGINKEPAHCTLIPYPDTAMALV